VLRKDRVLCEPLRAYSGRWMNRGGNKTHVLQRIIEYHGLECVPYPTSTKTTPDPSLLIRCRSVDSVSARSHPGYFQPSLAGVSLEPYSHADSKSSALANSDGPWLNRLRENFGPAGKQHLRGQRVCLGTRFQEFSLPRTRVPHNPRISCEGQMGQRTSCGFP
jgi:hypothetical protein